MSFHNWFSSKRAILAERDYLRSALRLSDNERDSLLERLACSIRMLEGRDAEITRLEFEKTKLLTGLLGRVTNMTRPEVKRDSAGRFAA